MRPAQPATPTLMAPFVLRLTRPALEGAVLTAGFATGGFATGFSAGFIGGFAGAMAAGAGFVTSALICCAAAGAGIGFFTALAVLGLSFDFNILTCFTPGFAAFTAGAGLAPFLGCALADFDPTIRPPELSVGEI
jgi:hypothetical protein